MPNPKPFALVSAAVANGDSAELAAAAELVVATSNAQALEFGLLELSEAKATELQYEVVAPYLLVHLEFPESSQESHWAWIGRNGVVTNVENEFVPPPVNAVTATRSHGATWRYYPEMPLVLREHFGV